MHLPHKGFMEDYMCWYAHKKLFVSNESKVGKMDGSTSSASNMHGVVDDNSNPYMIMVMNAMRMNQGNSSQCPIVEEKTNIKSVHGCRLHDFGMKRRKKQKNTLEIRIYKAEKTWRFGGISGRHTSRRIYERNISSTWHLSGSHDTHSLVPRTGTGKFTVRLPHTPVAPFHSLHIRNG